MAVKVRIPKNSRVFRILKSTWGRAFLIAILLVSLTAGGVFSYY